MRRGVPEVLLWHPEAGRSGECERIVVMLPHLTEPKWTTQQATTIWRQLEKPTLVITSIHAVDIHSDYIGQSMHCHPIVQVSAPCYVKHVSVIIK